MGKSSKTSTDSVKKSAGSDKSTGLVKSDGLVLIAAISSQYDHVHTNKDLYAERTFQLLNGDNSQIVIGKKILKLIQIRIINIKKKDVDIGNDLNIINGILKKIYNLRQEQDVQKQKESLKGDISVVKSFVLKYLP